MRASKQARARASRARVTRFALHRALKSSARPFKIRRARASRFPGNLFNIINESDFSRLKKLHASDRSSLRPEKSNAYMQGSNLLALKRKIQEVENTKSAGNLKRIKHEKN
jgi:hypothetical protein